MKQYLARACLALHLALLSACGGGSDPMPVVQPFLVIATVNGLPVPALGLKYSVTMESGDSLELKASPAGMEWKVTADGNVIEAQASEDGARWSAVLTSPKGGQIVIQAQSTDDPSQQATITAVVRPQQYARGAARSGEVNTWRESTTRNDGAVEAKTLQDTTTTVGGDGSHSVERRDITGGAPGRLLEMQSLDADANHLSRSIAGGPRCTYAPVRDLLDFPLYYGKSWQPSWQVDCDDGGHERADGMTTVDGYERITVAQGQHDALRLTTHLALTQSNDVQLSGGPLGQAAYAQDIVCWWSVTLQRTVQCTIRTEYAGTQPPGYADTVVQELSGHR